MKRIIATLFIFLTLFVMFGILSSVGAQSRNINRNARRKQRMENRPPKINSFMTSNRAILLCPEDLRVVCSPSASAIVTLTTEAFDPDGDRLLYKYSVTGGRVFGEGRHVTWDLNNMPLGSYAATVEVSDLRGGRVSNTLSITVDYCNTCHSFCPIISVDCSEVMHEGQEIAFTANVTGGDPNLELTYTWSISAGKIIDGQGTYRIIIDATGLTTGEQVIATVKVGGIPPECANEASCKTEIGKRTLGMLFTLPADLAKRFKRN